MLIKVLIIYVLLSVGLHAEIKVGDDAPTFFVRDLAEKNFFFSDSLKLGRPTVLSFFATWCGPCRLEMPVLDTLSQTYKDVDFYLINVSGLTQGKEKKKEDPEKVKIMVESLGVTLQVLMDKYGKVAEKYGVKSLPRLVVIDDKSKVYYIHDGYAPGDENKLKEVLDKLVDAKK